VLTFYLCGSLCGIDIRATKEITRNVMYTHVPGVAPHIVGLINLRGQVVTLVDLAQLLCFSPIDTKSNRHCIILKNIEKDPDPIGFFIDKLGDVIHIAEDMCEPAPSHIFGSENKLIDELVKLNDEILLILNYSKLYQMESLQ